MKFNVGDKVRAIKLSYPPDGWPELTVGELYTVEEVIGAKGYSIVIAERIDLGTPWENFKTAREFDSNDFELVEPAVSLDVTPIPENKFQVGDIVEAFGEEGVVIRTDMQRLPIVVKFGKINTLQFNEDGRIYKWTKEPALKLISRPVKELTFDSSVERWDKKSGIMTAEGLHHFIGKQVTVTVKIKE